MYLKRGNYTHEANEVLPVQWGLVPQFAENNRLVGTKRMATLRGRLHAADASALTTAAAALESAYALTSGNLVLLQNDGTTETHMKIDGSKSVGGIRCTRLQWLADRPASFTSFLDYEIDVEADFVGLNILGGGNASQSSVMSWSETISFRGTGGPRRVIRELRNGPPQVQIVSERTPIYATQRGEAVGLYRYPDPPSPMFPQYEQQMDHEISRTTADSVGGGGGSPQQSREFRISWSFSFQASGPIQGNPGLGF